MSSSNYDATNKVNFNDFNAYVVSLIYDKYAQLFRQEDANNKGIEANIVEERTVESIMDSKLHYALLKTANFLRINNINPVYYLSAVFSHHMYNDRNKKRMMIVPYEVGIVSEKYKEYYQSQLAYDRDYHTQINGVSHETIRFIDNPYISFMYQYYGLLQKCHYNISEMQSQLIAYQYKYSLSIMVMDDSKLYNVDKDYIEASRKLVNSLETSNYELSLYVMQLCTYRYFGAINIPILLFGTSRYYTDIISDVINSKNKDNLYLHTLIYGLRNTYDVLSRSIKLHGNQDEIDNNLNKSEVKDYYDIMSFCRELMIYFSSDLATTAESDKPFSKELREQFLDTYGMPVINI